MDNLNLEVLQSAAAWLAAGRRCQLVTVVRTWGSSPRPVGSLLAVRDDGAVIGSVSGGCIEDDLIERAQRHRLSAAVPRTVTYGVNAEEAQRFGLPCGGTMELVLEPLGGQSRLDELLARLNAHELVTRCLDMRSGCVKLQPAAPGIVCELRGDELRTQFGPQWRLLVIGAGPLSRFLAQIAAAMDYRVTVCDPREEYCGEWNLPHVSLVHAMPDDVVIDMRLDAHCAVVALTHDPKLDDLALMEALKSDAFYVGAIGSRLNNARRRERLLQFELTPAQLARLHGPIGLYIGSKTPSEIAIAILAEMTAVRNGVPAHLRLNHAEAFDGPSQACAA